MFSIYTRTKCNTIVRTDMFISIYPLLFRKNEETSNVGNCMFNGHGIYINQDLVVNLFVNWPCHDLKGEKNRKKIRKKPLRISYTSSNQKTHVRDQ